MPSCSSVPALQGKNRANKTKSEQRQEKEGMQRERQVYMLLPWSLPVLGKLRLRKESLTHTDRQTDDILKAGPLAFTDRNSWHPEVWQ